MRLWRCLAGLLLLTGCVNMSFELGKKKDKSSDPPAADSTVAPAINRFAVDLYRKVASDPGNLIFSPLSISTVLASLVPGAAGTTKDEMLRVLHLPGAVSYRSFMAGLDQRGHAGGAQWTMANRAWVQNGLELSKSYVSATKNGFGYEIGQTDFAKSPENARLAINQWVEQQTQKRILDLFPPGSIGPDMRLVLANAIYFKGFWDSQFDKKSTSDASFHLSRSQTATVPTMTQRHVYPFGHFGDVRVLELPYRGNQLSMVVVLPDSVDGLAALEKNLSAEYLQQWANGLHPQEVEVELPRFLSKQKFDLTRTLADMGMPTVFDAQSADLSGITGKRDLFLGIVVHGAFVEVNEEGTEAAAATGGGIRATATIMPETFHADHPFLYFIRDRQTGAILFMGRLVDPRG